MARNRRREVTRVRSGTYNAWRPGLNTSQQMADIRRLMRRANTGALSEVDRELAARLRSAGFGLSLNKSGVDNAVIWDRDKYKRVRSFSQRLNENTFGGIFRTRFAEAVLLKDKKTGETFWQVATHLAAGSEGGSDRQKRRIQAEQIIAMNRLVHRLAKSGNPVIVGGDFNRGGARLKGMRNVNQTDVMYTMARGAKNLNASILGDGRLNSDHGALINLFRILGERRKGGGKGGDGDKDKGGKGGGKGGKGGKDDGGPVVTDGSAYALLEHLFTSWGLPIGDDIEKIIKQAMIDGITPDKIDLIMPELQESRSWKRRFRGNEILKEKGLPVLSVAEYLSVEKSYAQIMKNNGLPDGFYDDPSDFAKFIGNSVSANELQQRTTMFADLAKRQDPAVIEQLKVMGLSEGDILAHFMDPQRAMPLLQKKYQETLIGAAAQRTGLESDRERIRRYADLGVTEEQAIQGFGIIGEGLGTMQRLGDIYDDEFGQSDFEAEVFEQDGNASRKRKRLASRERANFSGSSGVGQGSLSRPSGGSY